jgi:hypothetical protein
MISKYLEKTAVRTSSEKQGRKEADPGFVSSRFDHLIADFTLSCRKSRFSPAKSSQLSRMVWCDAVERATIFGKSEFGIKTTLITVDNESVA